MATLTLDKILQSQGFGSRREARSLVRAQRVAINGVKYDNPFTEFSSTALANLILTVDDVDWPYQAQLYIALHKPAGYECSQKPQHHLSVLSLLPAHFRARDVQCVGRLDVDTTGLLLLSDDGHFIHALTSPKKNVPKVYRVTTSEPITPHQVQALLNGVGLQDGTKESHLTALACTQQSEQELELTIGEGKYHQVKRMMAAVGNHVAALHRIKVGEYALDRTLLEKQWCLIQPEQIFQSNTPS